MKISKKSGKVLQQKLVPNVIYYYDFLLNNKGDQIRPPLFVFFIVF